MLHSSARDCGWSLMLTGAVGIGLRRRRNHAWIEAMLRSRWTCGGGAEGGASVMWQVGTSCGVCAASKQQLRSRKHLKKKRAAGISDASDAAPTDRAGLLGNSGLRTSFQRENIAEDQREFTACPQYDMCRVQGFCGALPGFRCLSVESRSQTPGLNPLHSNRLWARQGAVHTCEYVRMRVRPMARMRRIIETRIAFAAHACIRFRRY